MVMAINARWKDQGLEEKRAQITRFDVSKGHVGHLWELYSPCVTYALVPEAFENGEAQIPAALMRERLPEVVARVQQEGLVLEEGRELVRSIMNFVAFCEEKEWDTGEPCTI